MTMRELAREAGVSVGTVSKAFRQSDEISEQTRIRIFEIAKENGCLSITKKSMTINGS